MTATGNESHIDNSVEVAARAAVPGHPLLMSGDGVQCHGASISTHWHWPIWGGGHQDQEDHSAVQSVQAMHYGDHTLHAL